ncbi:MAG: radical SAM/SPASM domain-containing protein [Bdellovibrionota bacterium]
MANKRLAKIYVEISNACNLACDFCPSGVSDKEVSANTQSVPANTSQNPFIKTYVTADHLRHILREGRDLTEQFTFHVLGEPTAHPEFAKLVDIAHEENAPLNITTNGILIHKPEIQNALLSRAVQQVNFSLQSWTANFKIENVQNYLTRVFAFIDRAQAERPDLYINLRLWNFGSPEESLLHNLHFLKPLEEKFRTPLTEVNTNVEMKKSHKIEGRIYLHFDSRFEWPDPSQPVRSTTGHCYGLKNHIGILANGTVVPCCLDSNGYINLGNIHDPRESEAYDSRLSEILASPRAKKIYHGFEKHKLVEDLCQKCTYIQRFDSKLTTASI